MKLSNFITILLLLAGLFSKAQYDLPFGFQKNRDIAVEDSLGVLLNCPWAGGMNACQFGEIDLNADGLHDLVVFDKHGNRTMTFRNSGQAGPDAWKFAPGLSDKLPRFDDWVIFADYNMDGLNDIFTYSKGFAGIKVYKNTGDPEDMFELVVYPYLTSFQGGGYVNVLVTYVDYPGIFDLDQDGDLDLLTFWGLGSFVELHLNESMEKYGTADSLIFRKTENCWGRFAESEESNIIYLDTCFGQKTASVNPQGHYDEKLKYSDPKHTGSTFMLFDENGDGLTDLLLGDVDYSTPALLINGGSQEEAFMTSHTFTFPDDDEPINLLSFPVAKHIDLNNDGKKDMVVSPFDPSLVKSRFYENNWYYENNGTEESTVFELQNKKFLQEDMLDFGAGAAPVLFDHNADGLMDIVVSNFGYYDSSYLGTGLNLYCIYRSQLALLENTGTLSQPGFKLVTRNYANLPGVLLEGDHIYGAYPAFADLDDDQDQDMLLGHAGGSLLHFENVAQPGQPAQFEYLGLFGDIDVGDFSVPQFIDLNDDGYIDLVVGKRNGTISYFQNTGSPSPIEFAFLTDSLGGVNVRNPNLSIFGFCIPHFFRDDSNELHLFAGSEFGEMFYYNNINNNLDGDFKLVMQNYLWIDEGWRSAIAIGDLNADEYPDMLVGNYSGGLAYFGGTTPPPALVDELTQDRSCIEIFPNPADDQLFAVINPTCEIKISGIKIINLTGDVVYKNFNIFDQQITINTTGLRDGFYLLQISGKRQNGKLIKEAFKIIIDH